MNFRTQMNSTKNKDRGILLVELLTYLAITMVLIAIAVPNVVTAKKRIGTKSEMEGIRMSLALYEAGEGALPAALSSLSPNYCVGTCTQDEFGVNYGWTVGTRTLCSTSFSPSYCVVVP